MSTWTKTSYVAGRAISAKHHTAGAIVRDLQEGKRRAGADRSALGLLPGLAAAVATSGLLGYLAYVALASWRFVLG